MAAPSISAAPPEGDPGAMNTKRRFRRTTIALLALAGGCLTAAPAFAIAPANDDFANAASLGSPLSIGTSFSLDDATNEVFEAEPTGTTGHTVWFTWTAPAGGWVQVAACTPNGTVYDTVDMYTGNSIASSIEHSSLGPALCGVGHTIYAFAGTTYHIQVSETTGFPHAGSAPLTVDERTAGNATITLPAVINADASGAGNVKSGLTFDGFDWNVANAQGDCKIDGSTTHVKYCYAGSMAFTGLTAGPHTLTYRGMDPWHFWSNTATSTIMVPTPTPNLPVTTPTIPVTPVAPTTTTTSVPEPPVAPTSPCPGKPVIGSTAKVSLRTLRTHGQRITFTTSNTCPLTLKLSVVGHKGTLAAKAAIKTGTRITFKPSKSALKRLHVRRGARLKVTATNAASAHTSITVRVTA
jgi:hypothetical protein